MKTISHFIIATTLMVSAVACKKGANSNSEVAKKLMAKAWKYDTNANLANGNESLEANSGIKSDLQLGGDVKAIADFVSEKLIFGKDKKDESLVYEKKYGSGIISTTTSGYFELKDSDKVLVLREWDNKAGKEKAPVEYNIKELTEEKLVLVDNKANKTYTYIELEKFNKQAAEQAEKEKAQKEQVKTENKDKNK